MGSSPESRRGVTIMVQVWREPTDDLNANLPLLTSGGLGCRHYPGDLTDEEWR